MTFKNRAKEELKKDNHILVTGGAGYIGSHTVVQLLEAGYEVTILDNFCNSSPVVIDRIEKITGRRPRLVEGDVRDDSLLAKIFNHNKIGAVIHFAGLKAVGESEANPVHYYENNVIGSIVLVKEMIKANIKSIVFSSSATVYGDPGCVCYTEDMLPAPVNVYGRTKLMVEDVLRDTFKSDSAWRVVILRYFNPVGAHPSGLIGEDPVGTPNNLMPFIAQVAVGRREKLSVFGGDYSTPDGTGLRDYIHVVDLASGHLAALTSIFSETGLITVNLGTGRPYSVLELVNAFERASGKNIPYQIVARRQGDLAEYYADSTFAQKKLNWSAKLGLKEMCEDVWNWQSHNPSGYC